MEVEVSGFSTNIYPTDKEVDVLCKPETEDTCIWLTMGIKGWQCVTMNKPWSLVEKFDAGETNAKRDGCEAVDDLIDPMELGMGTHEVDILTMIGE